MYFYYARYKPMNMTLTFWTFFEVLLSLFVCIPTILVAFLRFRILGKEKQLCSTIVEVKSWRHNILRAALIPLVVHPVEHTPWHPIAENLRDNIKSEAEELDKVRLTNSKSRKRFTNLLEYIILTIFVVAIITFELLYGLLMVFIQLSAQVDAAIIQENNKTQGCDMYCQAQNEKLKNTAVKFVTESGIYNSFKPRQHCVQTVISQVDGDYKVSNYTIKVFDCLNLFILDNDKTDAVQL